MKQMQMKFNLSWKKALSLAALSLLFLSTFAQSPTRKDPDAGKTVAQVEKELAPMAFAMLNDPDMDKKVALNKTFIERLSHLLRRQESYDHPFDSLKTLSILRPADNSFRIFTWYLVDRPTDAYYAEDAYYYFGLIQRKHIDPSGKTHFLVLPLMELDQVPKGFESIVTDNYNWFGALYYKPKDNQYIESYDGFFYKLVPGKGEVKHDPNKQEEVVTFIPGKYRGRTTVKRDLPQYSNYKRVKTEVRYYVLTGWNGWDNKGSYKVVDVLSFDPEDSMKVNFGAPIFYFDQIPKARAMFKYSDYGTFTLNFGMVRSGLFKLGKRRMLIYDHLAPPQYSRPTEVLELGPDGSYDALSYYKKHGGYFEWYRNVETAEKYESRKHAKEMAKLQAEYAKGDSTFPDYDKLMTRKEARKAKKATKREYNRQARETDEKLKNSGIELKKKQ